MTFTRVRAYQPAWNTYAKLYSGWTLPRLLERLNSPLTTVERWVIQTRIEELEHEALR